MTYRGIVVALLVASLAGLACGPGVIEPPAIDESDIEPAVAESIGQARDAVSATPGSAAAWGELGMRFQAHKLFVEAARCYRQAAELDGNDYRWPYLAGVCVGKTDRAAELPLLEQAADLDPDNPAFHVHFADVLSELGRSEHAEAQYRAALDDDPETVQALYGLGVLALRREESARAAESLESAVEIDPGYTEAHQMLAQVYRRQGEDEAAELAGVRARAFPDGASLADPVLAAVAERGMSSRAFSERGLELAARGRYAEAEAAFRQVLERRQPLARDLANLGGAIAAQGRHDEAVAVYLEALALSDDDANAHNNLALALISLGRLDEARRHLDRALEIDPVYEDAWFNLGLLQEALNRPAEASSAYERVIEINPGYTKAHNNLARLRASQGATDEAIRLWLRATTIDPGMLDAAYNLALLLAGEGRHAESIGLLEDALVRAPNSSLLSQALAWELATAPDAALRDGVRARGLADRLYGQFPNRPGSAEVMAAVLAENGEFDRAVEILERAVKQSMRHKQIDRANQLLAYQRLYRQKQPFRQPAPG